MTRYTFDPVKDAMNFAKHAVSLAFGAKVFDDPGHVVLASFRPIDGEDRYKAVGMVEGRCWTAVYIERGDTVRLISVRKSNAGEQGRHDRDCRRPE